MATNDDVKLEKGGYSVTLFTTDSSENFKNALTVVTGVVTPTNQATGVKKPTVVDLLRITHSFSIDAWIVPTTLKTAKQIKTDLIGIFNGADVDSIPAVLTYEDATFNVFPEDCVIKKVNNDDVVGSGYTGLDSAEYHVTLSLVEGKLVGT